MEEGDDLLAIPSSSTLALSLDENGGVTVVDLQSGGRVRLEGITASAAEGRSFQCMADPTGTRLLWADMGQDGADRLGVVDLHKGTFLAFDRENQDDILFEYMYWLNDGRVAGLRDLGYNEDFTASTYHLCVYEF